MNKRVLIIDDEPDILEAVQIILESSGFTVVTMPNFISADEVAANQPDLILLDFLLVGKNGKEVCEALKQNQATQQVPIIMLSAHPLSKLKTFVQPTDVVGYIQKPFEMEALITAVQTAVS